VARRQAAGLSRTEALAEYFRARPHVWIDGRELEFAGRYAWRSRVSDCRRRGLRIDNRLRRQRDASGSLFIISEYRFIEDTVVTAERRRAAPERKEPEATAHRSGSLF
jgi:hypothetical protein